MSRYGAQAVDASAVAVVAVREREKNRESAVMIDATSEDRGKHSKQCTISEGRETSHGHYILSVDPISYTSH
jgi:hypothetical protein